MHSRRWALALFVLAVAPTLTGCRFGDLGVPCKMVRAVRGPDGGITGTADILQGDLASGLDYLSFGVTECEDFVCVRDSHFAAFTGEVVDPAASAGGYCSRSCRSDATCVSGMGEFDNDPEGRFYCRPMVLDEETLAELCRVDPSKCNFPQTTSYCARRPPE